MTKGLGQSLMSSLKQSNLSEALASFADITTSQSVNSPLAEIPVFGTLLKFCRAGIDVRSYLFTKKVYSFLYELTEVPQDKRISFAESLENEEILSKVGENVILIIERVDDMDKASVIGRIFAKWIEGKTDQDTFFRLAHVVNRSHLADLKLLAENHRHSILHQWLNPIQLESLYNLGLLSVKLVGTTRVSLQHGISEKGEPKFHYYVSDLAHKLVFLGFN